MLTFDLASDLLTGCRPGTLRLRRRASTTPAVSANGRYVAFQSTALNLVAGQTGGAGNIFLLDRNSASVVLVSHIPGSSTAAPASGGSVYPPIISRDGAYVVYTSPALGGVVVYNRATGQNTVIGSGKADAISGDDRCIVFEDDAANDELFVYDQMTHTTLLVSHAYGQNTIPASNFTNSGASASIADNDTIAYVSAATNLVNFQTTGTNVYLYSPSTQSNQLISTVSGQPSASAGGCLLAQISGDGSAIAYVSTATNLVPSQMSSMPNAKAANVFVYNTGSEKTTLVSGAEGSANVTGKADSGLHGLAVSHNGQSIVFDSLATNLVSGQPEQAGLFNVFLYAPRVGSPSSAVSVARPRTGLAGCPTPISPTR